MDTTEKIKKLIVEVEKKIDEEEKRIERLETLMTDGNATEDESDEFTYYDGFKDGLYKELNDLRSLI